MTYKIDKLQMITNNYKIKLNSIILIPNAALVLKLYQYDYITISINFKCEAKFSSSNKNHEINT